MVEGISTSSQENNLDAFHAEIAGLNLANCNCAELTQADLEMYAKLKSEILTIEEFETYRNNIRKEENASRIEFVKYVANKLTVQVGRREVEEFKKQRQLQ